MEGSVVELGQRAIAGCVARPFSVTVVRGGMFHRLPLRLKRLPTCGCGPVLGVALLGGQLGGTLKARKVFGNLFHRGPVPDA